MKTDNELIAEFMGLIRYEPNSSYNLPQWYQPDSKDGRKKGKFMGYPEQLKYDTSWDWLMPVVEKIAEYRMAYPKEAGWVCDCKIVVLRHLLYREVVNFIKWHNNSLT